MFRNWVAISKGKEFVPGKPRQELVGKGLFNISIVVYGFDLLTEIDAEHFQHLSADELYEFLAVLGQIDVVSTYGCVVNWMPNSPNQLLSRDEALVIFPHMNKL